MSSPRVLLAVSPDVLAHLAAALLAEEFSDLFRARVRELRPDLGTETFKREAAFIRTIVEPRLLSALESINALAGNDNISTEAGMRATGALLEDAARAAADEWLERRALN